MKGILVVFGRLHGIKQRLGTIKCDACTLWGYLRQSKKVVLVSVLLMTGKSALGLVIPYATRLFIDKGINDQRTSIIPLLLCMIAGAAVFQSAIGYILERMLCRAAGQTIADLRARVCNHTLSLPLGFFDSQQSGEIVGHIINDTDGLRYLVGSGLAECLGGILTASVVVIAALLLSPPLCVIVFLSSACVLSLLWIAIMSTRRLFSARFDQSAAAIGALTESFSGIREIKICTAETRVADRLKSHFLKLASCTVAADLSRAVVNAYCTIGVALVMVITLYGGGVEISRGDLTIGGLVSFLIYMALLVSPFAQIANVGTSLSESLAGLRNIERTLHIDPEQGRSTDQSPLQAHGLLSVEHVTFSYGAIPVLQDISVTFAQGTNTALVGGSGVGKSTLVHLLTRLRTPQRGKIALDGIDVSSLSLHDYRRLFGCVLQEPFLFAGSVRDNILLSNPRASEACFRNACRLAYVDEMIERLPNGFDSLIGERGVRLSGGQKQRIAIARALVTDPVILIFDEATSHLDGESERYIRRALAEVQQRRTLITIAHRLSTVQAADAIVFLQDGCVAEVGPHARLHASSDRYRTFWEAQSLENSINQRGLLVGTECRI